jgi:LysR family transcriptional regulator of abg operon
LLLPMTLCTMAHRRRRAGRADKPGAPLMNLNALVQFVAIGESGSLGSAATALGLSRSAVTKSIRLLEAELKVTLLERGSRGSTMTPYGLEFLSHARLICNEVETSRQRLRQLAGDLVGTVRIAHSAATSIDLLPAAISYFHSRYPGAEITTMMGLPKKTLPYMLEGSMDLVIGPYSETRTVLPKSISATHLFPSRSVVIARRGHPLAGAKRLADLAECTWILSPEAMQSGSALDQARCANDLPPFKVIAQTDDPFLIDSMVRGRNVVAIMRKELLPTSVSPADIVQIELEDLDLNDQIMLFSHKQSRRSDLVQRFVDIIITRSRELSFSPSNCLAGL